MVTVALQHLRGFENGVPHIPCASSAIFASRGSWILRYGKKAFNAEAWSARSFCRFCGVGKACPEFDEGRSVPTLSDSDSRQQSQYPCGSSGVFALKGAQIVRWDILLRLDGQLEHMKYKRFNRA
jgi:hypothetical protein